MNLRNKINKLKKIKNDIDTCDHPLWYFWSEDVKVLSTNWTCQCLECGVFKIDKSRKFKGKVIINSNKKIDTMFESVQFDYKYLEEKNYNEEKIKRLLIRKYNK